MNRFTLLQDFIDQHGYQNFSEIGTHKGRTFYPLDCKSKTAVDPNFKISIPFFLNGCTRNHLILKIDTLT